MNYILFNFVAVSFFLLFLYRLLNTYLTKEGINNEIIRHLSKEGYTHIKASKLSMAEKFKYGVPSIWFIGQFYKLDNALLKLEYVDSFKIEYIDSNGKEWTKYVEITFNQKKIISYSEFDSFEI